MKLHLFTDKDERARRQATCLQCPHFVTQTATIGLRQYTAQRCGLCNCMIQSRTHFAAATCPAKRF